MLDVVIVGGGPAGLLTAARCAAAGLDVLVLEEHAEIGAPTHCTGIVSLETAKLAKIPDDLILKRLARARLRLPGQEAHDLIWDDPNGEQILVIDRAAFDRQLADEARAAGASVETEARVTAIRTEAAGIEIGLGYRRVRAHCGVLACGVSYRFQRQLGLGLPAQLAHTAQVEVDAVPTELVEVWVGRQIAPGGFSWVVPIVRAGRERLKIGLIARADAGGYLQRFLAQPAVQARFIAPPDRPIRRLLPLQPICRTWADNVLAVGDAGGFTKPTTGGGIFYSLLTASLAADTLIEAFQAERFDREMLGRYEQRWQAVLGQELRVAGCLRQALNTCTDAELARLLRAFASEEVQAVIRRTARFNWHGGALLNLIRHPLIRHPGVARLLFRFLLQ
jgi:digeranylgeranylglycerophospholipid reductase